MSKIHEILKTALLKNGMRPVAAVVRAQIAALHEAGYVIVPVTSQLLEKGRESGVKLVDPDFGAPTGFRSE